MISNIMFVVKRPGINNILKNMSIAMRMKVTVRTIMISHHFTQIVDAFATTISNRFKVKCKLIWLASVGEREFTH